MSEITDKLFTEIDTKTLYQLFQLRINIFVVEQKCFYNELDGKDTEPKTRHIWISENNKPVSYLRVATVSNKIKNIGRVATLPEYRNRGLASKLVNYVITSTPDYLTLNAQEHLESWYTELGFTATGKVFEEAGIPHIPMVLSKRP